MDEKSWNVARLIPTSGINGAEEQERRATSALLAVMSSVKEFGRVMTGPLGAPSGQLETFIEVPFDLNGKRIFPDGLIRARRGSKSWTALVEVKTGTNELTVQQLENYLDVARENGFDALITISNQLPPSPGVHPTPVDGRKLRKVALHHWSWTEVLTQAVMQKEYRGVADPEQAWILGELVRYLEHPKSGAMSFEDMGAQWVPVRDAVQAGTLRASDKAALDVSSSFDALIRFAALRLGRRLGAEVTPVLTRAEVANPASRLAALSAGLVKTGNFSAALRIPNAVSDLAIVVDLRSSKITCSFDIDAPREGRSTTRINWLVRQLKDSPGTLRIEAHFARGRADAAELLRDVRENPAKLATEPTKEIKSFTIAHVSGAGSKRSTGRGGFIDSVLDAVDASYEEIGQRLKAWAATPPRLRSDAEVEVEVDVPANLPSAALSSQDE
ncbi:stress response protein [Pseudolysinimonas yzui]|uniref:Stress response protein n=1 Tax=Pseudolysinimonas yzui TaxID=2708254 RepID=A0A8J3GNA6_9MICO|nr:stress response protein [Pseudolysinimonas yzui]GHF06576.1 hypothetical protein GCM10011600_03980 [Pseudolysinimonas yzui]